MKSGRLMLKSVPESGAPVVQYFTFGLSVRLATAQLPAVMPNGQDGSVKYPPTPFGALLPSRPWNRLSRPLDIGSIASAGKPDWSIASGSFSSTFATQPPGVVTPIAPRNEVRVPEPTCGSSGWMVLAEAPPMLGAFQVV